MKQTERTRTGMLRLFLGQSVRCTGAIGEGQMGAESSSRFRALSGLEVALGIAFVVGHNVLQVLPNEVPVLVALGLVSARVRDGSWLAFGLNRPPRWWPILAIATTAVVLRLVLGGVVESLGEGIWPPVRAPQGSEAIHGDPMAAMRWLGIVWTFAAFGEEIAYRGYLMRRAAQTFGGGPGAWALGALLSAVLFGFGHYYKGPVGMIDSGISGLVLAGSFFLARRSLWAPVLAHGLIDTVGVVALYLGLSD